MKHVVTQHPVLAAAVVGGLGILVEAVGYARGWAHLPVALPLFFVGHVLLVAGFAALLTAGSLDRGQRLAGCVTYGVTLYFSWYLSSPLLATRFDETLHVSTLLALVDGDGLFAENAMLPVSPYYPGLELGTAALHWLTGLPLMACQVLFVLAARVALVACLFLVIERLTRSSRAAALGTLLYCASSQFHFFNAQFSYQTLSLPLALLAVLMLLRAVERPDRWPWPPLAAAVAALAALTVTHHLTSWLTLAALWTWAAIHWWAREDRAARLVLTGAVAGTLLAVAWTALVGSLLASYLLPIAEHAQAELTRMLMGGGAERELFADRAGDPTPVWERGVMLGAMLLWVGLLLPAGLWGVFRKGVHPSPARMLPLAVASTYPFLLVARFSPTAAEMGERASSFVAMAMCLAIGAFWVRHLDRVPRLLVVAAVCVMGLGGAILGGGPDWSRVPGPFMVGAEQRSVDRDSVAFARWVARYLPADSRFASDVTTNRVVSGYAQDVQSTTSINGGVNVTPLFLDDEMDSGLVDTLRRQEIDFVFSDLRMAGQLARSGDLFEGSDDYGVSSVSLHQLTKFGDHPAVTRLLDGPYAVYDVRALRGVPRTFEDDPGNAVPGTWSVPRMLAALAALLLTLGLVVRRGLPAWSGSVVPFVLPGLLAIGAVGTALGYQPALGTVLLLGIPLVVVLGTRGRGPVRRRPSAGAVALATVVTALYAAAILVACLSQWHGLLDGASLPSPLGEVGA